MKKYLPLILSLIPLFDSCSLKYTRDRVAEKFIPQIIFEDALLNRYEDNSKTVSLKTSLFEQYDGSDSSFAQDCEFYLYDDRGNTTANGTCVLMNADTGQNIYTFYDGLSFTNNEQGIVIKGDTLKWDGQTEQLVSVKGQELLLKKDDFQVSGKNFTASAVSNTFQFSQGVQGSQILTSQSDSSDEISFSADSMSGRVAKGSGDDNSTVLSGNAFVKTSTMEIHADRIELSGKEFRYLKCQGHIKGFNSESQLEFEAGALEYDRENKIVILSEDVVLKDMKNDVTAKAQIIEYNQTTDVAVMQIDVELSQKDSKCYGAYALYRKKEQTLELSGNAKVAQEKDTFRAQSISFNLETRQIDLDGNVRGTVTNGGVK